LPRDLHGGCPQAQGAHVRHRGGVFLRGFPARAHGNARTGLSRHSHCQERQSELIAISDSKDILEKGSTQLPIAEGAPEWLSPVLAVIPGQLLGLNLAVAKGYDPDSPRGLRKVTVTR